MHASLGAPPDAELEMHISKCPLRPSKKADTHAASPSLSLTALSASPGTRCGASLAGAQQGGPPPPGLCVGKSGRPSK